MTLKDPETLAGIGAQLRARREELGMTLETLSAATVIRVRHLVAIERGEADKLPGEATLDGYVRDYAERVGLDGDALLGGPAPEPPAAGRRSTWSLPRRHTRHPTRRTWLLGLVVVAALVVLAIRHAATPRPHPVVTPAAQPVTPPQPKAPPAAPVPVAVRPAGISGGVVAYRVTGSPTIIVDAHTTGRCWVSVQADGKTIFTRTLLPGKNATWQAQRDLRVRVGDFGTIRLTVNGIPLGVLNYRSPSTLDFQRVASTTSS